MKIYTRTGDRGETGTFGGPRLSKDAPRIEAYGAVDELNAVLGLARCEKFPEDIDSLLQRLQNDLFDVGAQLATPDAEGRGLATIDPERVAELEREIDRFEETLPPLKQFILPGGGRGAATLHLARTVCRRAERRTVTLAAKDGETVSPDLLAWLNRLADLLFVLSRAANAATGKQDIAWRKRE